MVQLLQQQRILNKQTTSGVSRALQRLESKLNVTLLERTTRKLKLTQEGQLFLAKARISSIKSI